MKVAIVHYWLVAARGGERVLAELCRMYPDADVFTHVCDRSSLLPEIASHRIRTSFIQHLPCSRRWYKYYLPLMPWALSRFDLRGYDLIISSESGPAKGVRKPPGAKHVCYCHTPMRYIWDLYDEYRDSAGVVTRVMMSLLVPWLRRWDRRTAHGVDLFIANSGFVSGRIARIYGRDARVVYPPVSVEDFRSADGPGEYYLCVGELTPYKQPQLAVEAFNRNGRPLVVVGSGELEAALRSQAGPNITFRGKLSDEELKACYTACRALVFPGIEDFGIVPVEAMASGRPVIAYREGGALETVKDGVTGLFFDAQTVDSLNLAIDAFERIEDGFDSAAIRAHAAGFAAAGFRERFEHACRDVVV